MVREEKKVSRDSLAGIERSVSVSLADSVFNLSLSSLPLVASAAIRLFFTLSSSIGRMGNRQGKGRPDLGQLSRETLFPTKKLDEWLRFFNSRFPDGKVNREEFVAIYREKWNCPGDASDLCDHVFRHYDRDGNGSIDFRELMTALSASVKGSIVEKLQWTFKLYDINGDGCLSRGEVIRVLTVRTFSTDPPPTTTTTQP